jgi:hypothetical protein
MLLTGGALVVAGITRALGNGVEEPMGPRHVVAVGDSLTAHGTYCEALETLLPPGSTVDCYGWQGEGTAAISANITPKMFAGCDDAIVLAGVNDLASGRSVQETVEGLERLYQKGRQAGARVIAVELTPWSGHAVGRNLVAETAEVNKWMNMSPSVELTVETSSLGDNGYLRPEFSMKDGLHLNNTGQAALGMLIFEQAFGG